MMRDLRLILVFSNYKLNISSNIHKEKLSNKTSTLLNNSMQSCKYYQKRIQL